jgi:hypothetical protein
MQMELPISLSLLLFVCRSLGGNMNFPAQNSRPLERERLAATLTSVYTLMRHIVCQIRVQNELFAARPAPTQTEENYSCCRGCLLVRRLIVFSTSMKWKRVIIQGNQQPRHGSMFSEHARLALRREREREMCYEPQARQTGARCCGEQFSRRGRTFDL